MDDQPVAGRAARRITLGLIGFVLGAAIPVYRGTVTLIDWYSTGKENSHCHFDKGVAQYRIVVIGPTYGLGGALLTLGLGAMFRRR